MSASNTSEFALQEVYHAEQTRNFRAAQRTLIGAGFVPVPPESPNDETLSREMIFYFPSVWGKEERGSSSHPLTVLGSARPEHVPGLVQHRSCAAYSFFLENVRRNYREMRFLEAIESELRNTPEQIIRLGICRPIPSSPNAGSSYSAPYPSAMVFRVFCSMGGFRPVILLLHR